MSFEKVNAEAIKLRESLPRFNYFEISELMKTPTFWGLAPCQVDDISFGMFLAGRDDGVALKFLWNGHYERQTLSIWQQLAKNSKMILDIGAHTGAYTLTALKASKRENVISFEPHHMNFARLSLNLRANGFSTKNLHMLGAGDKNETKIFKTSMPMDYLPTGGSSSESSTAKNEFLFPLVSLDQYLSNETRSHIDLIKMDVEGYEWECITGMKNIIELNKPTIFLESINQISSEMIESLLSEIGYKFYLVDDKNNLLSETQSLRPILCNDKTPDKYKLNRIAGYKKKFVFK